MIHGRVLQGMRGFLFHSFIHPWLEVPSIHSSIHGYRYHLVSRSLRKYLCLPIHIHLSIHPSIHSFITYTFKAAPYGAAPSLLDASSRKSFTLSSSLALQEKKNNNISPVPSGFRFVSFRLVSFTFHFVSFLPVWTQGTTLKLGLIRS